MQFLSHDEQSTALRLFLQCYITKDTHTHTQTHTQTHTHTHIHTETRVAPASLPSASKSRELQDPSLINYGAGAANLGGCGPERYYLTTAINYTNGNPHMGHAYEAVTADVIVRCHRLWGKDCFFLTGTDEHGQKIANTAAAQGKQPIELCDFYANGFQTLNQRLLISNNAYIRTTMEYHHRNAQELWKRCSQNGDIYLSNYEGWYNEREETFVTDADALASDYKDPATGLPLKHSSESSYFFRMSKYQDSLLNHIEENPQFIQPANHRNAIVTRLKEELHDLSISRTSFTWGIPMPEGFEQEHVMYVWFDALSNYLSGVHALENHELAQYWPANAHIIGKDIVWFHCVIWPCMLMSAGVELPRSVFAHGFVNAEDGRKMSKSLNNSVDPHDLLDKYSVDSFRYYLCQAPYGSDLNFSEEALMQMHNSELADTLGNLVHRAVSLCEKYCGGEVVDVVYPENEPMPFDCAALKSLSAAALAEFSINIVCFEAMRAARDANKYLTENEPWKLKGDEFAERRAFLVRIALESIYIVAHFLGPFIPQACASIFDKLSTPPIPIPQLNDRFQNLRVGTKVTVGDILFDKLGEEKKEEEKMDLAKAKEEKKQKQKLKQNKQSASAATEDPNQPDFTKIDLRVGKIVRVWPHEGADRLYCEEIDVGEETPRPIASGLREHYTLEQMQDRQVIVVCNLKPSKMVGFDSTGMVLAAKSSDGRVELVRPPEGSRVGERIFVEGLAGEPVAANTVKKKKVWEAVAVDLRTNSDCVACYQSQPLQTSAGVCVVDSVVEAPIS